MIRRVERKIAKFTKNAIRKGPLLSKKENLPLEAFPARKLYGTTRNLAEIK